jgi:hypothetical protein
MLNEYTALQLRKAMEEWEHAKGWREHYTHEDVLGEYTERENTARLRVVSTAKVMIEGETP